MRITLASLLLLACSSSVVTQAAPDATSDPPIVVREDAGTVEDAAVEAGPRPAVPALPIIPNQGGPIVPTPEIITLTWSTDPIAGDLEGFDDWLVASPTWKTMMAEWGVGPGTHLASYRITTAAPGVLDEDAVQKVIDDAVSAGLVPAPSANRIYAVYPPSGTRVTSFGAEGCEAFQAYHYGYPHASGQFAIYAITPRCADTQGMSAVDYVTWGMSHEIMEASSDPQLAHQAFVIDEQTDATPELGENADLCAGHPTKIDGHMITRNWSNVAGPSVPIPAASKRSLNSPLRPRTSGARISMRVPWGHWRMLSAIWAALCRSTGLLQLGQCGVPARAYRRRR